MLLNDIGPNPTSMLKKVNYYLESTYGFKISENTTTGRYETILEQIEDEIHDLKLKGEVSKNSSEISKRLLILEGITYLREYYNQEFQSPDLEKVCGILCDFVCDCFKLSGTCEADFDSAVEDAMKHYRSSRYRFPDAHIEDRVRSMARERLGADAGSMTAVLPVVDESDYLLENSDQPGTRTGKIKDLRDHGETPETAFIWDMETYGSPDLLFKPGHTSGLHYAQMRGHISDPYYVKIDNKVYKIAYNDGKEDGIAREVKPTQPLPSGARSRVEPSRPPEKVKRIPRGPIVRTKE